MRGNDKKTTTLQGKKLHPKQERHSLAFKEPWFIPYVYDQLILIFWVFFLQRGLHWSAKGLIRLYSPSPETRGLPKGVYGLVITGGLIIFDQENSGCGLVKDMWMKDPANMYAMVLWGYVMTIAAGLAFSFPGSFTWILSWPEALWDLENYQSRYTWLAAGKSAYKQQWDCDLPKHVPRNPPFRF